MVMFFFNKIPWRGENNNFTRFVILTFPRTGSNYLISILRNYNQIITYHELFYNKFKMLTSYSSLKPTFIDILYRNFLFEKFFNKIFKNYNFQIEAVGFKLTYYQLQLFGITRFLQLFKKYNFKIIHLKRKNLLHSFCSQEIMNKTNIVHRVKEQYKNFFYSYSKNIITEKENYTSYTKNFIVKLNDFIEYLNDLKNFDDTINTKFNELSKIEIYYENLINNPQGSLKEILIFLKIKTNELKTNSIFLKLNNDYSKFIRNYEELFNYYKNNL